MWTFESVCCFLCGLFPSKLNVYTRTHTPSSTHTHTLAERARQWSSKPELQGVVFVVGVSEDLRLQTSEWVKLYLTFIHQQVTFIHLNVKSLRCKVNGLISYDVEKVEGSCPIAEGSRSRPKQLTADQFEFRLSSGLLMLCSSACQKVINKKVRWCERQSVNMKVQKIAQKKYNFSLCQSGKLMRNKAALCHESAISWRNVCQTALRICSINT